VDGDHSFPAGGLVDISRTTYEKTPLAVVEVGPKISCFVGGGGTVTAVGGSRGTGVSAFLFQGVAVPGMCLGEPNATEGN
jgi:hypothetical protein